MTAISYYSARLVAGVWDTEIILFRVGYSFALAGVLRFGGGYDVQIAIWAAEVAG